MAAFIPTIGALRAGQAAEAMGKYQSKLAVKRSKEEYAVGAKKSAQERRRGRLLMSRARAVAGANGGGADMDLIGEIATETEMRSLNAIWEGKSRASDARARGREALADGKAKKEAYMFKAASSLLGSAESMMAGS